MLFSKSLLVSIGVCSYLAVGVFAYYRGYTNASDEYRATLNQLQTSNLKAILNQERIYKEKENAVIQDYQDKIQLLKEEYDKVLIAGNTLPSLNPVLDVTQKPIYSERLKKVWLSETNVTN